MEIYKAINGYSNYEISNMGNVKNIKTGRVLKSGLSGTGYIIIRLCKNNKATNHYIHKLVANAFLDNPDGKTCVDHIDNNKTNNDLSNLRFATHLENSHNKQKGINNTSGVKGVSWHIKQKKWIAYIRIDGILVFLGYYDTIEEAKQARINKANAVFGVFTNSCEKL